MDVREEHKLDRNRLSVQQTAFLVSTQKDTVAVHIRWFSSYEYDCMIVCMFVWVAIGQMRSFLYWWFHSCLTICTGGKNTFAITITVSSVHNCHITKVSQHLHHSESHDPRWLYVSTKPGRRFSLWCQNLPPALIHQSSGAEVRQETASSLVNQCPLTGCVTAGLATPGGSLCQALPACRAHVSLPALLGTTEALHQSHDLISLTFTQHTGADQCLLVLTH